MAESLLQEGAYRNQFETGHSNGSPTGYPGGERVFQVLWAVGNIEELVAMASGVEAIARMMGCTAMLIEGRPAWRRVLEPHGYRQWSVTLHKKL